MKFLIFVLCCSSDINTLRTVRNIKDIASELVHEAEVEYRLIENYSEIKKFLKNKKISVLVVHAGDILISDMFHEKISTKYQIIKQPEYSYIFNKSKRLIQKNIEIEASDSKINVMAVDFFASRHFISPSDQLNKFLEKNRSSLSLHSFHWKYLMWLLEKGFFLVNVQEAISFESLHIDPKLYNENQINNLFTKKSGLFKYENILMNENFNNIQEFGYLNNNLKGLIPSQFKSGQTLLESMNDSGVWKGMKLTTKRLNKRLSNRIKKSPKKVGKVEHLKNVIFDSVDDFKSTVFTSKNNSLK